MCGLSIPVRLSISSYDFHDAPTYPKAGLEAGVGGDNDPCRKKAGPAVRVSESAASLAPEGGAWTSRSARQDNKNDPGRGVQPWRTYAAGRSSNDAGRRLGARRGSRSSRHSAAGPRRGAEPVRGPDGTPAALFAPDRGRPTDARRRRRLHPRTGPGAPSGRHRPACPHLAGRRLPDRGGRAAGAAPRPETAVQTCAADGAGRPAGRRRRDRGGGHGQPPAHRPQPA